MLFAVVQARTENNEIELKEVSIISRKDSNKVRFKGFIEGETVSECKSKIKKLNSNNGMNYKLYGQPFTQKGQMIYLRRND